MELPASQHRLRCSQLLLRATAALPGRSDGGKFEDSHGPTSPHPSASSSLEITAQTQIRVGGAHARACLPTRSGSRQHAERQPRPKGDGRWLASAWAFVSVGFVCEFEEISIFFKNPTFQFCGQDGTGKKMVPVSPKLILLSELVVGRTDTFCIQGNILHLPKMNYSGVFTAYLTL